MTWIVNMPNNDVEVSDHLTSFLSQCAADVAMRPHR